MMAEARKAVPVPVDRFLIMASSGMIRLHCFDAAGDPQNPIHRTSIALSLEQASILRNLLNGLFHDFEAAGQQNEK